MFPKPVRALSLPVVVFFNLVIIAGLSLVFLYAKFPIAQCTSPPARAVSEAVIIFFLYRLFWHSFGKRIKQFGAAISFGPVAVPLGMLATISDELDLRLPGWALWGLALLLSLPALYILSLYSPIPVSEPVPVVQSFATRYDQTLQTHYPGEDVDIPLGKQLFVEAKLLQAGQVVCSWDAVRGTALPGQGCSTFYNPPLSGKIDTLNLNVQSFCKTQESYTSLHIRIVSP